MTSQVPTQQVAAERPEPSLARDLLQAGRYYLLSRTGLISIAAVAIIAGAALNWSWLVATGIAPILIAVLPCAIMCGLGLCFHRLAGSSCAQEQSRPTADVEPIRTSKAQLDPVEPAPSASAQIHERNEAQHDVLPESHSSDERKHTHA
jgi:hypothetical protein